MGPLGEFYVLDIQRSARAATESLSVPVSPDSSELQVLRPIVGAVAVDVVDDLVWLGPPPKGSRHNQTVLREACVAVLAQRAFIRRQVDGHVTLDR